MSEFTEAERDALKRQVSDGAQSPVCPSCGGPCVILRTGPRNDVSYVRNRIVVRCSTCLKSLGVETRRLES